MRQSPLFPLLDKSHLPGSFLDVGFYFAGTLCFLSHQLLCSFLAQVSSTSGDAGGAAFLSRQRAREVNNIAMTKMIDSIVHRWRRGGYSKENNDEKESQTDATSIGHNGCLVVRYL